VSFSLSGPMKNILTSIFNQRKSIELKLPSAMNLSVTIRVQPMIVQPAINNLCEFSFDSREIKKNYLYLNSLLVGNTLLQGISVLHVVSMPNRSVKDSSSVVRSIFKSKQHECK